MASHRWTIPCTLGPEEAERALAEPLGALAEKGWALITHIETVGFFGWTLRAPDERAVGLSVPQPGTPDQIVIRSDHPELAERVIEALTATGPLEGAEATPAHSGAPDDRTLRDPSRARLDPGPSLRDPLA